MSIKRVQLTTPVFKGRSLSCEAMNSVTHWASSGWRAVASQLMRNPVMRRVDDRRGATVSSVLSRHRHMPVRFAIAIVLLVVPSVTAGQDATTHSRWEFGGAAGLAVVGGDAFGATKSGVALSTYGAYHVGSGWTLRVGVGQTAHGDYLVEAAGQAVATPLGGVGFDVLLLSVGPVYRFAPPASLVAPYLGGQIAYMNGSRWGGGVVGGLTFWLNNSTGFDAGFTATTVGDAGQVGWALGHVVTLTGGFVVGLR